MNQEKIGKFIASCRKEQKLTQAALAEKLGITDRAVSKWETGRNLPDASIMPELCDLLNINISELFSGERIDMDSYKEKSDELLLEMKKQEELKNKKLLSLEMVIGYMASITFMVMIFVASFIEMPIWTRVLLIAVGSTAFIVGLINALKIEHDAGYYECPECKERYVPSMKAVVMAPHIGTARKMKCPYCGNKAYHKKVLTK
ncbi:MAG: helix-turn-helix domain-containing protein [Lachnospiraceae bacterium]|nr:helix-turn-helix domain-containing protein [Lachnospiraceae bacterium]